MKAIVNVYAKALDENPVQTIEFTGSMESVTQQIKDWVDGRDVIFDLHYFDLAN